MIGDVIMQEVIREIIKIDQLAFENQNQNEAALEERKQEYVKQMKEYKEHRLDKAEKKAEKMYKQIIEQGEQALKIEEERSKQATLLIENKYFQVEQQLVDRLFEELFVVEA